MPEALFDAALRESTVDVLEKMFFIGDEAEPAARSALEPPAQDVAVKLTFEGSPPGWLALRIGKAAVHSIAADFLGEDEETVTGQQAEEMACELANMICGSVLSRTESEAAFHLSSPMLVPLAEWSEPQDAAVHRVALAKGSLAIFMKTEASTCQSNEKSAS